MPREISITVERWPIAGTFRIARGAKTEAVVVVVEITADGFTGRGECVPYARYGESTDSVIQEIRTIKSDLEGGLDRERLQNLLRPGAARNAVDCALWDLDAKRVGASVAELAGLSPLKPLVTAYTLSLDTPENMYAAAKDARERPVLKVKLGGDGDGERIAAVRDAAPDAKLIIDANEGWTAQNLQENLDACARMRVALIEQPLPANDDSALLSAERAVPVCADESAHDRTGLPSLIGRYDAINIKMDKTGGLTEGLALAKAAEASGLSIMVGCMLATSLAMAPAFVLAQLASTVDLDGPLLLAEDRKPCFHFEGSLMMPPEAGLWG